MSIRVSHNGFIFLAFLAAGVAITAYAGLTSGLQGQLGGAPGDCPSGYLCAAPGGTGPGGQSCRVVAIDPCLGSSQPRQRSGSCVEPGGCPAFCYAPCGGFQGGSSSDAGFCGPVCGDNIVMSPEQCDNGSKNGTPGNPCASDCTPVGSSSSGGSSSGGSSSGGSSSGGSSSGGSSSGGSSSGGSSSGGSSSNSSIQYYCCNGGSCQTTTRPSSADSTCPDQLSIFPDKASCIQQCTSCGNGRREFGEQCDDGNTRDLDGCDHACKIERGWQCVPPGGVTGRSGPGNSSRFL